MNAWVVGFWLALAVVAYTYVGYGLLMGLLVRLGVGRAAPSADSTYTPPVTLVVPAYNEAAVLEAKLANCRQLDYPADKLTLLFVTDGSTDGTDTRLARESDVTVLHDPVRMGKPEAMNRAVRHVQTPVTVFSDANTQLSPDAVRRVAAYFKEPAVGCVAGEKRVVAEDAGSGAGESLYWRYESTVKRWESRVGNVMGAAGELFAIRTDCYAPLPANALLDDFVLSFRIAMQGRRLVYAPEAYALEHGSASLQDEWTRKVRISGGGIQSVIWLAPLLNPFRYGLLSFQYISHRVLRWTLTPILLLLLLPWNGWLALRLGGLYGWLFLGQLLFYGLALVGWSFERRGRRWKPAYITFYFSMMNAAVFAGAWRYVRGRQNILWRKAARMG